MIDRVWQVPEEKFVAAWNGAGSLAEAAEERTLEPAYGIASRMPTSQSDMPTGVAP